MSEKFLDSPDVRTVGKQRSSERMPERMGRNVLYDAGLKSPLGNRGRNEIARKADVVRLEANGVRSVVMPDEKRSEIVVTRIEIVRNPLRGTLGQVYDANLSAFSTYGEFARFEVDAVPVETRKLGYAESGRIDAFENREVTLILDIRS